MNIKLTLKYIKTLVRIENKFNCNFELKSKIKFSFNLKFNFSPRMESVNWKGRVRYFFQIGYHSSFRYIGKGSHEMLTVQLIQFLTKYAKH